AINHEPGYHRHWLEAPAVPMFPAARELRYRIMPHISKRARTKKRLAGKNIFEKKVFPAQSAVPSARLVGKTGGGSGKNCCFRPGTLLRQRVEFVRHTPPRLAPRLNPKMIISL